MAWQVPRPCTPCVGLHAGRWTVQRFGPYVPSRRCQKRRLCAIRALRALLGRLKGYRGDRPLVAQRATTCRRRAQILKGQSGIGAVDFVVICKCTWPAGMAIHRRVCNLRTRVDAGAAFLRSACASYNASQKPHRFHHPPPGHGGLAIAACISQSARFVERIRDGAWTEHLLRFDRVMAV